MECSTCNATLSSEDGFCTECGSAVAARFCTECGVRVAADLRFCTECGSPIVSEVNPTTVGACGKVRPGVDVRLVDANDCEVPAGATGEMIVRTDRPWGMNSGYYKNPVATANAWRNGWFHTGDAMRCDADGNYYFVDRKKDAIRRRGENIAGLEIDRIIGAHPNVVEVAAVPVPAELGDEEILAVVVKKRGSDLDAQGVAAWCAGRLAAMKVPRYVLFMDALPHTPTHKIAKHRLKHDTAALLAQAKDTNPAKNI